MRIFLPASPFSPPPAAKAFAGIFALLPPCKVLLPDDAAAASAFFAALSLRVLRVLFAGGSILFLSLTSSRTGSAVSSPEASRELGCAGSATGVSVDVRVGALLRLGAIVLIVVDEGVEVEEGKQGTEGRVD